MLCFLATSNIRDGGRAPDSAEAVSVCVGSGQTGHGGVRRRSWALSPASDSEDSVDGRHAQYHQQDVRFFERLVLDSHSRRRRVPRAPLSPARNWSVVAQGEKHSYFDDDDAFWSAVGAGLRMRRSKAYPADTGSHRPVSSRSPKDGGHVQREQDARVV